MPKRGRAYCGRTVNGRWLVGAIEQTTCPHCLAIHEAGATSLAAVEADRKAGRILDLSPETLATVERANAVWAANYYRKEGEQ